LFAQFSVNSNQSIDVCGVEGECFLSAALEFSEYGFAVDIVALSFLLAISCPLEHLSLVLVGVIHPCEYIIWYQIT
jgi:hypothetical protein